MTKNGQTMRLMNAGKSQSVTIVLSSPPHQQLTLGEVFAEKELDVPVKGHITLHCMNQVATCCQPQLMITGSMELQSVSDQPFM